MQTTSWLQYLPNHDTILRILFSHLDNNSHHHTLREYSVSILQTSKHLLMSKKKTSVDNCSVMCPQAKSGGGVLTGGWYAWLAANYYFCGLGGIPNVTRLVLQAWRKLHCNIIKQKSTHLSLTPVHCPTEQRIYHAVEPVLLMWSAWNQHCCARLAEQTSGASLKW